MIRTADTDVVVLTIATCVNVTELWISFGTGTTHIYIAAHEIALSLGPNKSTVPPLFMHLQDVTRAQRGKYIISMMI